jgi:hypothetical protein
MVDQSELAFRELCRRHGATCAYTPMIHARLFVEDLKYRKEIFTTHINDRPLLVQFCANDPDMLLAAASIVAPHCDGVDINFGCPQRIAKRGRYGAFLMDDWTTVHDLIHKLDQNLSVPVTAKIRVYDDLETSVKYAKMVEAAGAQLVAVHGRTREQKRAADVRANWAFIAEIKKALTRAGAGERGYTYAEGGGCVFGGDGRGRRALSGAAAREPESVFKSGDVRTDGSVRTAAGGGRRELRAASRVPRDHADTPNAASHGQRARAQHGRVLAEGVYGSARLAQQDAALGDDG